MSLISSALSWLSDQRKEHNSATVAYSRGVQSVSLSATVGRSRHEIMRDVGVELIQIDDFLIAASDLVLGGVEVEPARGDKVTDAAGRVFEVLPPGGTDAPHWEWTDGFRRTYRVHTKLVSG